jgi:hypothetical protein
MYITVKGRYLDDTVAGWRLVAVLRVLERFESHESAADWYDAHELPLPNNCLVPGNPPKPFELTHRHPSRSVRERGAEDPRRTVRVWDAAYQRRIAAWPTFLACAATFLQLSTPPQIRERDFMKIFGGIPGTRTPPRVERSEFRKLLRLSRRGG